MKLFHLPGRIKAAHSLASVLLCLAFSFSPFFPPVQAFNTYPSMGNIHRAILEEGLQPFNLSKESLKSLAKGMDSQDNPFSRNWLASHKHACDNRIREAFQYIDEQTNLAVELAATAGDGDDDAREKALYALGEGMHTLHDFYSHANYAEWLVRNKLPLVPIDRTKNSQLPPPLRSCYYFYASTFKQEPFLSHEENVRRLKIKYPDLNFRTEDEYGARKKSESLDEALDYVLRPGMLMHMEVNKDSAGQMEGRIKCGKDGETLFSVAKQLAVADTTNQWRCFEQRLLEKYGSKAGDILAAFKGTRSAELRQVKAQESSRKEIEKTEIEKGEPEKREPKLGSDTRDEGEVKREQKQKEMHEHHHRHHHSEREYEQKEEPESGDKLDSNSQSESYHKPESEREKKAE